MDLTSKFNIFYEALLDVGNISIFGLYLIILDMHPTNIALLGFIAFSNVFLFSYFMRKFIKKRDISIAYAMLLWLFPLLLNVYIIFLFLHL